MTQKNGTRIHNIFMFLKARNLHSTINFISMQSDHRETVKKGKY